MIRRIDLIPNSVKLIIALTYDWLALASAFILAYLIRLGFDNISLGFAEIQTFIITSLITLVMFFIAGVYQSVVRFFNAKQANKTLIILTISAMSIWILGKFLGAFVPRSIPIEYFVFSAFLIIGARTLVSFTMNNKLLKERDAVVIYGAGDTGRQLYQSLQNNKKYQTIAFIDDKTRFHKRRLFGLKVYPVFHIPKLEFRYGKFKILLALPNIETNRMSEIVQSLEPYHVEMLKIPSMSDIVSGKRAIDELKEVSVNDLLGREPVKAMPLLLTANIENKVVMVTGAGGSIGSELCRQILTNKPKKLILLDISEPFLYEIDQEIHQLKTQQKSATELISVIGSIAEQELVQQVMLEHQVETIYHAAAYKHVPIVEENINSGVRNNAFGTCKLAEAAIAAQVNTFVLISTDKAVRPTNVMGASKRLAELVLQGLAQEEHKTRFVMVRFGNVLGSSGSVVPLFKKQIRKGGPITVTHPDIIRYFMTIPEAAQLVIQAGAMGKGGDVFVLDMGKPVKIVDLAHQMAHLLGFTVKTEQEPNGDIAIEFTGLRPGEKLYEELLIEDNSEPTAHPRILTANEKSISWLEVSALLSQIHQALEAGEKLQVKRLLLEAPLGYQPNNREEIIASTITPSPIIALAN